MAEQPGESAGATPTLIYLRRLFLIYFYLASHLKLKLIVPTEPIGSIGTGFRYLPIVFLEMATNLHTNDRCAPQEQGRIPMSTVYRYSSR